MTEPTFTGRAHELIALHRVVRQLADEVQKIVPARDDAVQFEAVLEARLLTLAVMQQMNRLRT